jgi:hypothetical protein
VAVDTTCAKIMGFDPMRLAMLREAFQPSDLPLTSTAYERIELVGNSPDWTGRLVNVPWSTTLNFRPHFGWLGHMEGPDATVV